MPEIADFVGKEYTRMVLEINDQIEVERVKNVVQVIFTKFMTADTTTMSKLIYEMKSRLSSTAEVKRLLQLTIFFSVLRQGKFSIHSTLIFKANFYQILKYIDRSIDRSCDVSIILSSLWYYFAHVMMNFGSH